MTWGGRAPEAVYRLALGQPCELVWRNELGGMTFRSGDRFVKWNPRSNGIDLDREQQRLGWLADRHPVPKVLEAGSDDDAQWLVTRALPGRSAVHERSKATPQATIRAIGVGLKAMHAVPVDGFPPGWTADSWVGRTPPPLEPRPTIDEPVLVHGDGCAPNTIVADDGSWVGHVDLGDLAVGDRWADLAVASMSLDWNYGPGHQNEFFAAYGIEPDLERIGYYRQLWHAES